MKITKVTPLILGTPWRNLTFVKVETDEGLTGIDDRSTPFGGLHTQL